MRKIFAGLAALAILGLAGFFVVTDPLVYRLIHGASAPAP